MSRRKTDDEWIDSFQSVHGERYDYTEMHAVNARTPVKIICKVHGGFMQTPDNHQRGQQCRKCTDVMQGRMCRRTQSVAIADLVEVHGDEYDYSQTKYVKDSLKVNIICKEHGMFSMRYGAHRCGQGCPKCGHDKLMGKYSEGFFKSNPKYKDYPSHLYVIQVWNNNETFIKIGVTRTKIQKRFSGHVQMPYEYKVIAVKSDTLYNCWMLETKLHELNEFTSYKPSIHFGGHTECFTSILDETFDYLK